ncbi:MAG: hypothetical protein VXW65_12035 [Pseudomonadota bacterium]|nr:hypothetical protein [Pseudomonadota bacterium]
MRISTVAFLLGLIVPAAGYLYLRRWFRAMLAYGVLVMSVMVLLFKQQLAEPQGLALLVLSVGMVYLYALIDAWQIGRRIDARRLSKHMVEEQFDDI